MTTQPLLFIQGAGDMHAADGSGRLADYLTSALGRGYRVVAPEMPEPDAPRYRPWRDRIEVALTEIHDKVILVGHSFGGSVLLKYLAEGFWRRPILGLFLVSVPDWGPDGWSYEEFALPDDVASKLPSTWIFLYHSRDDPEVPFGHLELLAARLPAGTPRPVDGKEHSFVDGLPLLVEDIRRVSEGASSD